MIKKINKMVESVLVFLLVSMLLVVIWQVLARFLSQVMTVPESSFTEELASYLLIWLAMLGSAYVSGQSKHLAVDILQTKLNAKQNQKLSLVIQGLIILFSLAVMVFGGAKLVAFNAYFGQTSASLGIPIAYVYSILPISGLLIIIYAIDSIIKNISSSTQDLS